MKNLNFWTIIIVGISLSLIPLAFGFFYHWQPNNKEIGFYDNQIELLNAEIAKRPRAVDKLEAAKRIVDEKSADWQSIVSTRTPSTSVAAGGIDLSVNAWQLAQDARRFRNNVQRAVNAQVKRGGVTVIQGPNVPFPDESATTVLASYFNYPAIAFPVVIFNFGEVVVQGTYDQILANVRSYANMPNYLAVANGLRLEGTSPQLTGRYNLSIVGFIRGNKIFASVPEVGGSTSGGGAGFGGGPPVGPSGGGFGGPPPGVGRPSLSAGGPGAGPAGGSRGASQTDE